MKGKYSTFYALLGQMQGVEKEELIYQFTHGMTTSLSALSESEYRFLLIEMQQRTGQRSAFQMRREVYNDKRKRMMAKIYHTWANMGYVDAKGECDKRALEAFIAKLTDLNPEGLKLYQLDPDAMAKVVTRMDEMYLKDLKRRR